jgi:transcriptional regulator GlxA family with amidase domain
VVGPYEVFRCLPEVNVRLVSKQRGLVRNDANSLSINADYTLADVVEPNILVIPGGPGQEAVMGDSATLNWIRRVNDVTSWTTSVCTGSLVLAAAGLLNGKKATTHWLAMDRLKRMGADAQNQRVVVDGKYVTSAGVSAGIDMAISLTAILGSPAQAQGIELALEYDPQPPFKSGSPEKGPPNLVARMRAQSRHNQ